MEKTPKRPRDINQLAHLLGNIATGQAQEEVPKSDNRNPAAVALGKLGGAKGGRARAEALSPAKRKKIAKAAANARWKK